MLRAARPVRILYAAFATSVIGAAAVGAPVGEMVAPVSSPGELLAAGWIFAGLAWVVLGWLYAPNVSTYLGPGGTGVSFRGGAGPIIAVSGARPAANPEVLADLAERLPGARTWESRWPPWEPSCSSWVSSPTWTSGWGSSERRASWSSWPLSRRGRR